MPSSRLPNNWGDEPTRRVSPDEEATRQFGFDDEPTRVVGSGNEPTRPLGGNEPTRAVYGDEPTQAFDEPHHEPTRVMPVEEFSEPQGFSGQSRSNADLFTDQEPSFEEYADPSHEREMHRAYGQQLREAPPVIEEEPIVEEEPRKWWHRFFRNLGFGIALSAVYALSLFLIGNNNGNLDTTMSSVIAGGVAGVVCTLVASAVNILLNAGGNMRSYLSFLGLLYVLQQWLSILQTQGFGVFPLDEKLTAMLPIGLTVCGLIGGTLDKMLSLLDVPGSKVGFVLRALSVVSYLVAAVAGVTAFCAYGTFIGVYLTPWGESTLLPQAAIVLAIISVGLALALPKLAKIMKLLGYAAFLGSVGLGVFAILGYKVNPLLTVLAGLIN